MIRDISGWLAHALLLTRRTTAVGVDEPSRAFEFATVKIDPRAGDGYPLLEIFTEAGRSVAVARDSSAGG